MILLRSMAFNLFGFVTVMLSAALVLLTAWGPRRWAWAITVNWCRLVIWALRVIVGMRIEVRGRENVPDVPSVLMIKHTTTLETLWQIPEFPRTTWVLKREIFMAPILGWAIKYVLRPIGIDRGAGGRAVKQVIREGRRRLAEGTWVTIFPEGTRMAPGQTRKYGISGAALAREAACPVVPVAHNAGDLWPRRSLRKRPGTVTFVIGPPIDGAAQEPKETNRLVQNWIESTMREISVHYR